MPETPKTFEEWHQEGGGTANTLRYPIADLCRKAFEAGRKAGIEEGGKAVFTLIDMETSNQSGYEDGYAAGINDAADTIDDLVSAETIRALLNEDD